MAEGGGQKNVKNTLLNVATSTNFFEEAAMLVPVPLAEPQAPATAEIDLSDDSSSLPPQESLLVEKDGTGQSSALIGECSDEDLTAAPISLFSRAASSGVDAFTRMLAGTSAKPPDAKPGSEIAMVPQLLPSDINIPPVPMASSTANLFFGPASTAALLPPSSSAPILSPSPPAAVSSVVASISEPQQAQYTTTSSLFASQQPIPATILFPTNDNLANSFPASTVPSGLSLSPGHSSMGTSGLIQPTSNPTSSSNLIQTTGSLPSFPVVTAGPLPPNPSMPPPVSGATNTYRLGTMKVKYAPCPEMQSAPVPSQHMPSGILPTASPMQPPTSVNPATSYGGSFAVSPSPIYPTLPTAVAQMSVSSSTDIRGTGVGDNRNVGMHNAISDPNANLAYMQEPYGSNLANVPREVSPLKYHWFYRKDIDGKVVWKPFSISDSLALEDALANEPERLVATDGGRYDVCTKTREKTPVYWKEAPLEVRRGSWFYKGPMDSKYIPYDEEFSQKLEEEYNDCMRSGVWHKRISFPGAESIIMHSESVVVHFCQAAAPDDWGNLPESQIRPRNVKRGVEQTEMEDGESSKVDHLVFVVHGIGPICDLKLRNIVEAVDDFRGLSFQLLNSNFKESIDRKLIGRVEFLPVSWHEALHGDKGIDEKLKRITLRSIPKFRDFTNDTLLDILFYTSPVYCQTIVDAVGNEINRLYQLYLARNPSFTGKVSLAGHSLGSLILFDVLCHQTPPCLSQGSIELDESTPTLDNQSEDEVCKDFIQSVESATCSSRSASYTMGNAGTGQPFISYPTIEFHPTSFFALGSPIAMFVTVRGIDKLGTDFCLPTCPAFFNVFHPYDPVAYRIETLIDPNFEERPVLIPHHKGRKRMHLELKETMSRVGGEIKHRVMDAVKNTINTVYNFAGYNNSPETLDNDAQNAIQDRIADAAEEGNKDIRIGSLNGGRRIDYVLQEALLESFNEYVFAMSAHVGYWESEDTMLLMLTEIYSSMGIQPDNQTAGAQSAVSPSNPQPLSTPYVGAFLPSAPPYLSEYHYQGDTGPPPSYNISALSPSTSLVTPLSQTNHSMVPPNPIPSGVVSPGMSAIVSSRLQIIGNRPVADATFAPQAGVDPTAPLLTMPNIGPPPKLGFIPKKN